MPLSSDGYVYTWDASNNCGVWKAPSGVLTDVSFGTPSVAVGLTADPGTAGTALRSDARLALDQGISPTWTAPHTFNSAATFGVSPVLASGTASRVVVTDGSKNVTSSPVTTTALGYVANLTSDAQAQLNACLQSSQLDDDVTLSANSSTRAASQHATKTYVDNSIVGLKWKQDVVAASTANVTLSSAPSSLDGVTLNSGDRVLLKNQATASENGVYVFGGAGSALTRAADGQTGAELVSATFPVRAGTVNQDTWWTCTNDTITVGTTALQFTQTGGAGTYVAGAGLSLTGNSFSISTGGVTNAMLAGSISASKLVGTDIATVGTITTGTWQATPVSVAYGGTGQATALAAFNALSPLTARGDLLTRNATDNARLGVGAANTLLTSNGTDPAWGTVNLLSAYHGDTTAASVVRGDIITGQGATPKWSRLAISVPAANVLNVLGVANGDTEPAWKTVLDASDPATLSTGAASPGTSLVFAHRDHVHAVTTTSAGAASTILATNASSQTTLADLLALNATFNLINTTATTVNFAGAATSLSMGAGASTTVSINASTIQTNQATLALYNTATTTLNFGGAATAINVGASSGTFTVNNPTINLNASTIQSNSASLNLYNTVTTTLNFAGAATTLNIGAATGTATLNNATVSLAGTRLGVVTAYNTDLGQLSKKFKSIYAAELVVQNLVTLDSQVTTDGAFLIAPSAQLIAAVATSDTTVNVKRNNLQSGDILRFEESGSLEFMRVTSGPSTVTGGYQYSVARNLDGTGANAWNAGDAALDTGQAGNGYWDIFSLHSTVSVAPDFIYNATAAPAFSSNYAASANWSPFGDSANVLNGAIYFGVQNTSWNNLYFNVTTAASYSATLVWEYWNGSAWTSFTPTFVGNTNGDWKATGWQGFEWTASSLTSWASSTVNSQSAFWVRVRISAFTSWATTPQQSARRVYYNKGQVGPTQVLWKRNSSTWNDITEHAAFGELVGFYGYTASTVGIALGEYAAGKTHVTIDSTNGYRTINGLSTVVQQIDAAGNITVGQVAAGQSNVRISSGEVDIRLNTTNRIQLTSAGVLNINDSAGNNMIQLDASQGMFLVGKMQVSGSGAAFTLGTTPPTDATHGTGIWVDRTGIFGLNAGTQNFILDATSGQITATGATVSGAITATSGSITGPLTISSSSGSISIGSLPPTDSLHGTGLWLDRTGLYALNGGLRIFRIDATSGNVIASGGSIAGWTLSSSRISSTHVYVDNTGEYISMGATPPTSYGANAGVYLEGANSGRLSLYKDANNYLQWDSSKVLIKAANFTLDSSGNLTATSATISGAITATSGSFTGAVTISSSSGSFALGTTPPTSASAGTGVWMDRTGLYGLSSGNQLLKIDATSGNLVVGRTDSASGALIVNVPTNSGFGSAYWQNSGGANILAIQAKDDSTNVISQASITAAGSSTNTTGALVLKAWNYAGTQSALLKLSGGTSSDARVYADAGSLSGLTVGSNAAPIAMLDVRGDGAFSASSGTAYVQIYTTDTASFQYFQLGDGTTSRGSGLFEVINSTSALSTRRGNLEIFNQSQVSGGNNAIAFFCDNNSRGHADLTIAQDGGVFLGTATGSSKGAGTVNVSGDMYKNGASYTNPDYVLEHWATGKVERFIDHDGAREYAGLRPLEAVEEFARTWWHLPRFGQTAGHGLFSGGDALLASVEEAYLYLFDHESRVAKLERQVRELRRCTSGTLTAADLPPA
jgi:hypothetical protein